MKPGDPVRRGEERRVPVHERVRHQVQPAQVGPSVALRVRLGSPEVGGVAVVAVGVGGEAVGADVEPSAGEDSGGTGPT